MNPNQDDEIKEISFDEMAITDNRSVSTLAANALNQLEIALFKATTQEAISITNAIGEIEKLV